MGEVRGAVSKDPDVFCGEGGDKGATVKLEINHREFDGGDGLGCLITEGEEFGLLRDEGGISTTSMEGGERKEVGQIMG